MVKRIIFLTGFFSIFNAFYFSFGGLNLRVFDIFFILLFLLSFAVLIYRPKVERNPHVFVVFGIYIILTVGLLFIGNTNQVYIDNALKGFIHKINWILFYLIIYLAFKDESIEVFLSGLYFSIILNTLILFYEFYLINQGIQPEYEFLEKIGLFISEKKMDFFQKNILRPTGVTLDPNYAASYAGIAFLFGYRKRQWIYKISNVFIFFSIFLLLSRTAIFSLLLLILISFFLYILYLNRTMFFKRLHLFWGILIIILSGLIVFSTFPDEIGTLVDRFTMRESSALTRWVYIEGYFEHMNFSQILFGTGTYSAGYYLAEWSRLSSESFGAPESNYIAFMVENGLIFLMVFLFMLVFVSRKLLRKHIKYAYIFMYINIIGLGYNFLGDRIYMFLLVTLILYSYKKNNREKAKFEAPDGVFLYD